MVLLFAALTLFAQGIDAPRISQQDFKKLGPIFGEFLSKARPAATALICGLVDPAMKIEIEVTARAKIQ